MATPEQSGGVSPLDPSLDPIPHTSEEPMTQHQPEPEAPDWPEGQVPPEEQSDG